MTDYKKLYAEIDQIQDSAERLRRLGQMRRREQADRIKAGPPPVASRVQTPDEMEPLLHLIDSYVEGLRSEQGAEALRSHAAAASAGLYPDPAVHLGFLSLYAFAGDTATARLFLASTLKFDAPGYLEADLRRRSFIAELLGPASPRRIDPDQRTVDELEISVEAFNALAEAGIATIGELRAKKHAGFSKKIEDELRQAVKALLG